MNNGVNVPNNILRDAQRVKAAFPFRYVWIANKDDEWAVISGTTKARANNHIRKGWAVWSIG